MESAFLNALKERALLFDGAMGTSIQLYDLTAEDFGGQGTLGCNDYLVLTRPDVIGEIHAAFLAAGADVVETCSFQATRHRLAEWGIADKTRDLNVAAASLARKAADHAAAKDGRLRFVAGSMGPTGFLPSAADPTLSAVTYNELSDLFKEQAEFLIEGGVDVLLVETGQDILEMKAAVDGIVRAIAGGARSVPIMAQFTLDTSGRMLLGTDVAAAMTTLEALPVDVIGMNCSTGPEHMREPVRYLSEHSLAYISVIPNAGLPLNENGVAHYPLLPEPMAQELKRFVSDFGVNIVGGCCGTVPDHIAAIRAAIGDNPVPKLRAPEHAPGVSSAIRRTDLQQIPAPSLIGERVNAQGSKKVKRLLLAEDYDGLMLVGREQIEGGAHLLDVQTALTERADEAEQMRKVVRLFAQSLEAPLVIDTTEAAVVAAALENYPGRAVVNSINMENGRARIETVVPMVKRHGAAVVALAIDEIGMAKTVERKVAVARAIHDICVREYGLKPEDLLFDLLTFTLGTGDAEWIDSGWQTIEGIKRLKAELPGVLTTSGVSNVSFGLAKHARPVLNSVYLHHMVEAGLDTAIINPAHVVPYMEIPADQRELADDLVFNRRPDALQRFIEFYEANVTAAEGQSVEDPMDELDTDARIHYRILHRKKEGASVDLEAALVEREARGLKRADGAVEVLNTVLLPAMKDVGDKFGAGELILPFVLQSAEVMKASVGYLENFLEKVEGSTKGRVVLATVYGDVHDIGKSLVSTILSNNGYTVFDLGKQVPINTILEKAQEYKADIIGLSALLVSTSKQMPACIEELNKRGIHVPVLVGGAAINRAFVHRALFAGDGGAPYDPGIFYCKDAFEGLDTADKLVDPNRRTALVEETIADARATQVKEAARAAASTVITGTPAHSAVKPAAIPAPPFWGVRVEDAIPLDDIWPLLDLKTLFRLQWGAKNRSGEEWEALLQNEFHPKLAELKTRCETEGWLAPKVVDGYFPAQSEGNDVIVYDPAGHAKEIGRFTFPRQTKAPFLCLADYFAPKSSGRMDVLPLQAVTVGDRASEVTDALNKAGDYTLAYYLHGLSVSAAEAVAEWAHRRIQCELGIPYTQGHRYSWGYPACPDLEQHELVFQLLPSAAVGLSLSPAYQLIPEQSTAALVVHHPEAIYF